MKRFSQNQLLTADGHLITYTARFRTVPHFVESIGKDADFEEVSELTIERYEDFESQKEAPQYKLLEFDVMEFLNEEQI